MRVLCFLICDRFFSLDPPETDHRTPVTESARCPRRDGERTQQTDAVRTEQSTETGRTAGRGPPPRTQPEEGNEKDPCHLSGIDVPALRSESLGRYEQEGMSPQSLIWIYCLVKGAWRERERAAAGVRVRACVGFVCVLELGHVH